MRRSDSRKEPEPKTGSSLVKSNGRKKRKANEEEENFIAVVVTWERRQGEAEEKNT